MNKENIINELTKSRENILETVRDLYDQEMETKGVIDDWSVKDIFVHLTRCEAELVKLLWQAKQGTTPTTAHFSQESVDDQNARWHEESRSRPLESVLNDFLGVRNQTIRRVDALTETTLTDPSYFPWLEGEPLWKWIAGDSFEHESEHEAQILTWKTNKGE
ncbi:ClbS/DfsB family four-helix bundle protein [Chloroflexota bacterium]